MQVNWTEAAKHPLVLLVLIGSSVTLLRAGRSGWKSLRSG